MSSPVTFDRYIKLSTDKELDKPVVSSWMACVRARAPSGIIAVVQTTDEEGRPQGVVMVHREINKKHEYLIPLSRDMLPNEVEKIVEKFSEDNADLDFDIETNHVFLKNSEKESLTLDQQQHLELCMAMAKQRHEEWVRERSDAGWRYGTTFSSKDCTHPLLRPWDQLPDRYRKPDMDWPQKLVGMLNTQGYSIIRKEELDKLLNLLRGIV